jgi:hypothetical protein
MEGFTLWKSALDGIVWERYLETIVELKETGDCSKDIARHLLGR